MCVCVCVCVGGLCSRTEHEEDLHQDVADTGGAPRAAPAALVPPPHHGEAHVIGHGHRHVEGGQQDQPIPAGFEGAVVEQDEAGLLDGGDLVLWDGRLVAKHVLDPDKRESEFHPQHAMCEVCILYLSLSLACSLSLLWFHLVSSLPLHSLFSPFLSFSHTLSHRPAFPHWIS